MYFSIKHRLIESERKDKLLFSMAFFYVIHLTKEKIVKGRMVEKCDVIIDII